ncbi:uncharacterized protein EV422DRAFT_544147 [Fimicolochytrium jonesii]|uniref:uncharacterized protein n=1 Tax=Fimicolochytrium jonesii TaxID=1396493 RepID=UPI0022FDE285|nr:uncharacterized protein EV422DRAFT_544147 [Fimicolochytrium jonesii]KAI8816829.1 hypothetical protein EV422DRAFT_544147 [Fimicolochytrium jonesii]
MADANATLPDASADGDQAAANFSVYMPTILSYLGCGLSIGLCVLVIITYLLIHRFEPKVANRVSLRIAVFCSLLDLLAAVWYLVATAPSLTGPDISLCGWSIFLYNIFQLASLLMTAAISVNLLIVFVFKKPHRSYYEYIYYGATFVISIGFPTACMARGYYGYTISGECCWYTVDDDTYTEEGARIWEWVTLYGWVVAISGFCFLTLVLFYISVSRPFKSDTSTLENPSLATNGKHNNFGETQLAIRRVVSRLKWYSVVPFVSQMFSILSDLAPLKGDAMSVVYCIANFTAGAQGAIMAVIFFTLDPAVAFVREKFRGYMVSKYYLRQCTGDHIVATSTTPFAQSAAIYSPAADSGPDSSSLSHATSGASGTPFTGVPPPRWTPNWIAYRLTETCLLRPDDAAKYLERKREKARKPLGSGQRTRFARQRTANVVSSVTGTNAEAERLMDGDVAFMGSMDALASL